MVRKNIDGIGLVVIGNEILDGRVQDAHVANTRRLLQERNLTLSYVLVLPDDPDVITSHLRWAMARPELFVCCGGIGSTPDDHTRQCAARAADVPLEQHAAGTAILRERFGDRATPRDLDDPTLIKVASVERVRDDPRATPQFGCDLGY